MMASERLAFLLCDLAIKSTILSAAAMVCGVAVRHRPAATRHLPWRLCTLTLALLPLLAVVEPRVIPPPRRIFLVQDETHVNPSGGTTPFIAATTGDMPSEDALMAPVVAATASPSGRGPLSTHPIVRRELAPRDPRRFSPPPRRLLVQALVALWLAGAALQGTRIVAGLVGTALLRRRSRPIRRPEALRLLEECCADVGQRRRVALVETPPDLRAPCTWGAFRPVILLPESALDWPAARLQAVLLHETAHIRRNDWPLTLLARSVCALYWFNPLVGAVCRQVCDTAEQACDDIVLLGGVSPTLYASVLLEMIHTMQTTDRCGVQTVLSMAKAPIGDRIEAILGQHRREWRPASTFAVSTALAAISLTLVVGAVQISAQPRARFSGGQGAARSAPAVSHRVSDSAGRNGEVERLQALASQAAALRSQIRQLSREKAVLAQQLAHLGAMEQQQAQVQHRMEAQMQLLQAAAEKSSQERLHLYDRQRIDALEDRLRALKSEYSESMPEVRSAEEAVAEARARMREDPTSAHRTNPAAERAGQNDAVREQLKAQVDLLQMRLKLMSEGERRVGEQYRAGVADAQALDRSKANVLAAQAELAEAQSRLAGASAGGTGVTPASDEKAVSAKMSALEAELLLAQQEYSKTDARYKEGLADKDQVAAVQLRMLKLQSELIALKSQVRRIQNRQQ